MQAHEARLVVRNTRHKNMANPYWLFFFFLFVCAVKDICISEAGKAAVSLIVDMLDVEKHGISNGHQLGEITEPWLFTG